MRFPVLAVFLGTLAPAQAPLLLERIEAPMLYVSLAAAPAAERGAAGKDGQRTTLHRVLADPGVAALLGDPGRGGAADSGVAATFKLVEGLLRRSSGELELALLGIAPPLPGAERSSRPLLVMRARLPAADALRLETLLTKGDIARPFREVNGHQTFQLLGQGERPDFAVEVAVVGSDLVATNDGTAMGEVLGEGHIGAAVRRTLSRDERFLALRERLPAPPGSMMLYGDWPRLGRRLQTAFGGMPGFLLEYSGLGGAQAVMAVVEPRDDGLAATALLDFAAGGAARRGTEAGGDHRPRRGGRSGDDIDGWIALLQAKPVRNLVAELPAGGAGGLVMAIDPEGLSRTRGAFGPGGPGGLIAGISGLLSDGCRHRGLDFERQVLNRLGHRGVMQFLLMSDQSAQMVSAYAFAAKDKKAAQDLLEDVVKAVRERGVGRVIPGERRGEEQVEFRLLDQDVPARFGVVEDTIVLAFGPDVLGELRDEVQRGHRTRARRDGEINQALRALGARQPVSGVFTLDLRPLLDRAAAALSSVSGGTVDLSGVPSRHIGFVDLQEGRDGAPLLRVQVLCTN